MYKILLVEDEDSIREIVKLNLELEGYTVQEAINGKMALLEFAKSNFDLLILDVMLPEIDGYNVCKEIRKNNNIIPILFLTAKGDSENRVHGLQIGGDDYLVKPFNLDEFLLRVKNLLRRMSPKVLQSIKIGKAAVDFNSFELIDIQGKKLMITKKEVELLKLLYENINAVVSRDKIIEVIWGKEAYPSTRTVDNFIVNLRKYVEPDPKNPIYIQSIRGVGYRLINEASS